MPAARFALGKALGTAVFGTLGLKKSKDPVEQFVMFLGGTRARSGSGHVGQRVVSADLWRLPSPAPVDVGDHDRIEIMFKQQRKAAGYVPYHQLGLLKLKLSQAGYENHDGPKVRRDGEVLAARATFDGRDGVRQNHVQVVDRGTVFAVYAHTEPHTARLLDHAISALNDGASFAGGSKMLRNDLAAVGFSLMTYGDACEATRLRG
jgi:hypothetical protein